MGLQNGMASSMNDILTCTSNLVEEIQLEFAVNLELCINISYARWVQFQLAIFFVTIQSRSVCSQADTDINQTEL